MALKPCLRCGTLTRSGSYCAAHAPAQSSTAWRGGSSRAWRRVREQVLQRDGRRCVRCGQTAGLEVHHVRSRAAGGGDELANLVTLCHHHHADTQRAETQTR